jgi:hypothetical protein
VCHASSGIRRRGRRGAPVSSSFLYLAIVAVWAFFLVPRWIRRQHARPRPSVEVEVDVDVDVEYAAEYDAGSPHYYYDEGDSQSDQHGGYAPGTAEVNYAVGIEAGVGMPVPSPGSVHLREQSSRSRILKARRRLLAMHLLLTIVAVAVAALKITSWWVVITPAAMLAIYLLLLRVAAVADAGQARRRAATEARVWAARQRAYAAAMTREVEPSAQIIDISARVGDQLYDQYADATVRAVGD